MRTGNDLLLDDVIDLYVDSTLGKRHQGRGIGRTLIDATQREGGRAKIILLAAPAATEYYPHIGMQAHDSAWVLPADESVRTA